MNVLNKEKYVSSKLTFPDELDYLLGPLNAPLSLVEYGDYQCPFSKEAFLISKDLIKELGDHVCYTHRPFPLTNIHPNSELAAEAAEAAGAQGCFWEMHTKLYENQESLNLENIVQFAKDLNLNWVLFEEEIFNRHYFSIVRNGLLRGVRAGVNGTPTFFTNGKRYDGSIDLNELYFTLTQSENELSFK